ncbi:MAG: ABC transporter substrate-binding protein [Dehalococcoidia bacterium]
MSRKGTWCKFLAILLVLVLLVPILAACGDDDEEATPTPVATTPAATKPVATVPAATIPAVTTPAATTPSVTTSDKPVKVGAVFSWSGYGAAASYLADATIELVNHQVKQRGGVKVGNVMRPLDIIKYDMKSDVAGATQAATKAITQDNCVGLTFGGLTGADGLAVSAVAKNYNVLYSHFMGDASINTDYTNTLNAVLSMQANIVPCTSFALEVLKPKTVAFIANDSSMERMIIDGQQKIMEAAGVKTVLKTFYQSSTTDFAPILTKVKYEAPDLVIAYASLGQYKAILKQMPELGGWGNIKFMGASQSSGGTGVITAPGSDGMYVSAYWDYSISNPGSDYWVNSWKAYAADHPDWAKKNGDVPSINILPFYQCLWGVINAVEFAGSDDPAAVTKAARSGKLTFESPAGKVTWDTSGLSNQTILIGKVTSGKTQILRTYAESPLVK